MQCIGSTIHGQYRIRVHYIMSTICTISCQLYRVHYIVYALCPCMCGQGSVIGRPKPVVTY